MERLGDLQGTEGPGESIARVGRLQQPPIQQHAHRFDGIERDALGPGQDGFLGLFWQFGDEAAEEFFHGLSSERLEVDRREVAAAGAPPGMPVRQLRAGQGHDEQRVLARPFQQVLDEVQQRAVGPLEVLEHHDHRVALGHALDEQPPRAEQVLAAGRGPVLQPQQVGQAGFDPPPLLGIGDQVLQHHPQLGHAGCRVLLLGDAGPHLHHLGQGPIRDAFAV